VKAQQNRSLGIILGIFLSGARLIDRYRRRVLVLIISMAHRDEADRFRTQAEEARQQAERAISPLDKEEWLRVAEEWLKLAMSVEARR